MLNNYKCAANFSNVFIYLNINYNKFAFEQKLLELESGWLELFRLSFRLSLHYEVAIPIKSFRTARNKGKRRWLS